MPISVPDAEIVAMEKAADPLAIPEHPLTVWEREHAQYVRLGWLHFIPAVAMTFVMLVAVLAILLFGSTSAWTLLLAWCGVGYVWNRTFEHVTTPPKLPTQSEMTLFHRTMMEKLDRTIYAAETVHCVGSITPSFEVRRRADQTSCPDRAFCPIHGEAFSIRLSWLSEQEFHDAVLAMPGYVPFPPRRMIPKREDRFGKEMTAMVKREIVNAYGVPSHAEPPSLPLATWDAKRGIWIDSLGQMYR